MNLNTPGRYVRIRLNGWGTLSWREVKVGGTPTSTTTTTVKPPTIVTCPDGQWKAEYFNVYAGFSERR